MQVVILCGGQGTRLREVSDNLVPKPMVPVGEHPILWHIMKHYSHFGYNEFILCLGHLGWKIKEYFLNYQAMESDLTVKLGAAPSVQFHNESSELDWKVTLVETGKETGTGGRLKRVAKYLSGDDFMLTYGDGVSNVDLNKLEQFHRSHSQLQTITGVVSPSRFGELRVEDAQVVSMREKPRDTDRYINGGYMVFRREYIDRYLSGMEDTMMLERRPMETAAKDGELAIYRHNDFWQCVDTPRDWMILNEGWAGNSPQWKVW
jgi:glucose-1-phosphate cytidylyltransferase